MLEYVLQHPVIILYLAACWFVAAVISAAPPLPEGQNYFIRWGYGVMQIVGASLDKVTTAAKQSTAFKQVEQTLTTSDASGLTKLETAKTTTQPAEPTPNA